MAGDATRVRDHVRSIPFPLHCASRDSALVRFAAMRSILSMMSVRGVWLGLVLLGCSGGADLPVTPDPRVPGGGRAANLSIVGAQITQSIQDARGTLPLVAGRPAVINLLVTRSRDTVNLEVPVVLRLYRNGAVIRTDTAYTGGLLSGTARLVSPGAQFLIHDSLVTPGLSWQAEIDPGQTYPDSTRSDNIWPVLGPASTDVVTLPTFKVRFIPIRLTSHGDVTGNVTTENVDFYLQSVRRLLPVGRVTASVAPPLSSPTSFGRTPDDGGNLSFWETMLMQIEIAHMLSPDRSEYWYGIVGAPSGYNLREGGMASVGVFVDDLSGASRSAVSIDDAGRWGGAYAQQTVAHELGHNLGRRHARGCNERAPIDSAYPNRTGVISDVGFDVFAWASGSARSANSIDGGAFDLMSYCTASAGWISAYNYAAILAWRQAPQPPSVANTTRAPVTVVSGFINAAGVISLNPALDADAAVTPSTGVGDVTIELRGASRGVLRSVRVQSIASDHGNGSRRFLAILPSTPDAAEVAVRTATGSQALRQATSGRTSITTRALPNGDTEIRASGGEALLVRAAGSGEVLGIGWDGRVRTRFSGPMTVSISNGVRSVRRELLPR
jgi:hypothetical protein